MSLCLYLLLLTWQDQSPFDDQNVKWNQLEYKGSLLFWKLSAQVELDRGAERPRDLPPVTIKELDDTGNHKIILKTSAGGTKSEVWSWFDPKMGGATLGRKLSTGRQNYLKWFRFGKKQVAVQRLGPLNRKEKKKRERWSKKEFFNYQWPESEQQSVVSETTALFYLLSASNLEKPGDVLELSLFAGKAYLRVSLKVERFHSLKTNYTVNNTRQKKTTETLVIRLEANPVTGMGEQSEFELLGLEEDITVFLERQTRFPIRISGKAPIFGGVEINLISAKMRSHPGID